MVKTGKKKRGSNSESEDEDDKDTKDEDMGELKHDRKLSRSNLKKIRQEEAATIEKITRRQSRKNSKTSTESEGQDDKDKKVEHKGKPKQDRKSSRRDLKKIRQEEATTVKDMTAHRRQSKINPRTSSVSLLSFLIAQEVVSSSSTNQRKMAPIEETPQEEELTHEKERRKSVVRIADVDTEETLKTSKRSLNTSLLSLKIPSDPQIGSSTSHKVDVTLSSEHVLSHLLKARSKEDAKKMGCEEARKDENDETDAGTSAVKPAEKAEEELLLGYRNLKTNEVEVAVVPPHSYAIFQEQKEDGKVFTIIVTEEDVPMRTVPKEEIFGRENNDSEPPQKEEQQQDQQREDEQQEPKEQPSQSAEGKARAQNPLLGYIYPNWPKKK